jgi:hypothetical protein
LHEDDAIDITGQKQIRGRKIGGEADRAIVKIPGLDISVASGSVPIEKERW